MSLIEDLKTWTAREYQHYGWLIMVSGKFADLGTTWYALVTFPMFIEGNPIPAVAYQRYGPLGLILLTALALMLLTIVVEAGNEYCRRRGASRKARELVFILGYWVPGLFWMAIAFYNLVTFSRAVDVLPGF